MATGIHDYTWSTQIHTMITAFSLNDLVEAEVKIHFNLNRLPDRTSTMIQNNFKRGYKLAEGYGKVNSMTNILCAQFNIPRLPRINKYCAWFYQDNDDFKKWLIGMGVIMEIPVITSEAYDSRFSYTLDKEKHDPIPMKLMHQAVKRKYKKTITQEQRDLYAEPIEALQNGAIITCKKEYFLEDR